MLGLLHDMATRALKDTATNITETGEFVVNLVCEGDAEAMNQSCVEAPRDVSEVDYARIVTAPSVAVAPPRIVTSPASFECRMANALDFPLQTVVIGEVLVTHIADEFIANPEKLYLDTPAMKLIGRTHGSGWYARTSDQFELVRPQFDAERAKGGGRLMDQPGATSSQVYPKGVIAWLTVAVLFLLYIRSLADRYLMALMVEPIKADLGLSDLQISLLQGPAFAILYAICAIPVGLLLDRSSRRWVLFACIVVWSSGAAACGLAASFAMLALGRSLVGAGESGFTTTARSNRLGPPSKGRGAGSNPPSARRYCSGWPI